LKILDGLLILTCVLQTLPSHRIFASSCRSFIAVKGRPGQSPKLIFNWGLGNSCYW